MLNVIIATKGLNIKKLRRCLSSITTLRNANSINLLIVTSNVKLKSISNKYFKNITIVHDDGNGVYSAYELGIKFSVEKYVYFLGDDDIVLNDMDIAIDKLKNLSGIDVIVCRAYMQRTNKLSSNCIFKYNLLLRNWCHQSVIYNVKIFSKYNYNLLYKIQADHLLNIQIINDPDLTIVQNSCTIAYFSSDGLSSKFIDKLFRRDMSSIAYNYYGYIGYFIVITRQKFMDFLNFIYNI